MPDFIALDTLVAQTAAIAPDRIAVIDGERQLSYDGLDELIDRVAAALQADGRLSFNQLGKRVSLSPPPPATGARTALAWPRHSLERNPHRSRAAAL